MVRSSFIIALVVVIAARTSIGVFPTVEARWIHVAVAAVVLAAGLFVRTRPKRLGLAHLWLGVALIGFVGFAVQGYLSGLGARRRGVAGEATAILRAIDGPGTFPIDSIFLRIEAGDRLALREATERVRAGDPELSLAWFGWAIHDGQPIHVPRRAAIEPLADRTRGAGPLSTDLLRRDEEALTEHRHAIAELRENLVAEAEVRLARWPSPPSFPWDAVEHFPSAEANEILDAWSELLAEADAPPLERALVLLEAGRREEARPLLEAAVAEGEAFRRPRAEAWARLWLAVFDAQEGMLRAVPTPGIDPAALERVWSLGPKRTPATIAGLLAPPNPARETLRANPAPHETIKALWVEVGTGHPSYLLLADALARHGSVVTAQPTSRDRLMLAVAGELKGTPGLRIPLWGRHVPERAPPR